MRIKKKILPAYSISVSLFFFKYIVDNEKISVYYIGLSICAFL